MFEDSNDPNRLVMCWECREVPVLVNKIHQDKFGTALLCSEKCKKLYIKKRKHVTLR